MFMQSAAPVIFAHHVPQMFYPSSYQGVDSQAPFMQQQYAQALQATVGSPTRAHDPYSASIFEQPQQHDALQYHHQQQQHQYQAMQQQAAMYSAGSEASFWQPQAATPVITPEMAALAQLESIMQAMRVAAAASQQQQQQQQWLQPSMQQQQHFHGHRQQQHAQQAEAQPPTAPAVATSFAMLCGHAGMIAELSRTANGSSFVQGALKDPVDVRCVQLIAQELFPVIGDLLLDPHGCYVVKSLMDRLDEATLAAVLRSLQSDEPLAFSLCTHSLHTRRVVQHVMETFDPLFMSHLLVVRCQEVAMTQQGCMVMQRSMDHCTGPQRDALFDAVYRNFANFARDPFANYVIQHLLEVGNREINSTVAAAALKGRVVELSCNKFASNVVEKCLFHVTSDAQHQILVEMYTSGEDVLHHMLQDSFGNYIIQSSIALATFRDVWFINEHLRPVLRHTPYGHKIEARLDRRMKGKAVAARQSAAPTSPATTAVPTPLVSARGPRRAVMPTTSAAAAPLLPANEEPW